MACSLLVVGGGRMGEAIVSGLVSSGRLAAGDIVVVEPMEARRQELAAAVAGLGLAASIEPGMVSADGGAVLAVKPETAELVCRELGAVSVPRVLSIVAGLSATRLEVALGSEVPVVRAMPNTPALVGKAASAMAGGSHVASADLDWAEGILSAVGSVVRVPERQIDAVTGLSGSGPAYVFLVAEALIEAGVLAGLPRDQAVSLTRDTIVGSAALWAETGQSPEALRASVTSPGGTTAAGLRALEARAVRSALMEAVASAVERSRQLGR